MRKLTTILCLWAWGVTAFAQIPNCNAPVPINEQAYNILKNVDKSQIPTGVLYDYVFPWADVEYFDGTENADTTNFSHFLQAYSELHNSTINRQSILHPADYEKAIQNFHPDKKYHHPVGIIDYQFNAIKDDAVTNNLFTVSDAQLFDVAGRTESPYLTKSTAIASILMADESGLAEGTHYLHFAPEFVLTNTGFSLADVTEYQVFQDGVLVSGGIVPGIITTVVPLVILKNATPKVIKIVLITGFIIRIYKGITKTKDETFVATPCAGTDVVEVFGDNFGTGYADAYSARGVATIFYADGNCPTRRITKPIIFVDGFDPTNGQHAGELWENYINKGFVDGNQNTVRLGDSLRRSGYDIITFDQGDEGVNRGGAGRMENNGLALARFLEVFYAQHSATMQQGFIVVGASMGGKVARYAITHMEHNNIPHHVKLFVSFDSPQLGAQIPLGIQQFADVITQFGGLRNTPKVRNAVHQSDAAKQLVVAHSSTESEFIQAHVFKTTFDNNMTAIGNWPTQCRMIAIVDGNRNGVLKPSTVTPNPFGYEPIFPCGTELDFAVKKRIFPNCNANICYKMRSLSSAQTEATRCESLNFKVNKDAWLLKLVFGGDQFTTRTRHTQNQNDTSYDIAPGARFGADPLDAIETWMTDIALVLAGKIKIPTNIISNTNFIPTVSSVAYTFPNNEPFSIYKNFTGVNLSKCAGTTPFDTVYAPSEDLYHVDINQQVAGWFLDEIFNNKVSSCGNNPDCPEYLTLNSAIPNNSRVLKKAQKAIFIEEGFKADGATESVVFKGAIGCDQILQNQAMKPVQFPNAQNNVAPCSQPFEFDQARNYKTCDNGFTTFRVFVHNIDINTYAEFSTDGVNWFKANILDSGWEVTLPNNSQAQYFQARTADDRTRNISGYLDYCN